MVENEQITKKRPRLDSLDILQGIAMTLVVIGHHLFPIMPRWYNELHYYIYLFHMPLFVFISGFLMEYSYNNIGSNSFSIVKTKLKKFMPAYSIVGTTCFFLSSRPLGISQFWKEILMLFFSPLESEAVFLWYIYLLMLYYPLYMGILKNLNHKALLLLFAASICLQQSGISCKYFLIDYVLRFTPYFLAGIIISRLRDQIKIKRIWPIFTLALFAILSLLHFFIGYQPVLEYVISWIAIPALFGVAQWTERIKPIKTMMTDVSKHCYGIYLLHMFFIQAFYFVVSRHTDHLTTPYALVYLFVSTILSIVLSSLCWYGIRPYIIQTIHNAQKHANRNS